MIFPTDAELNELLYLEQQIKALRARSEELKAKCKEVGSFTTAKHVCAIKVHSRVGLPGLEVVKKALGMEVLERNQLIRTSHFCTVHVSKLLEPCPYI